MPWMRAASSTVGRLSVERSSHNFVPGLVFSKHFLFPAGSFLCQLPVQVRSHWHSATRQRFFTQKTHKKFCVSCGKPHALLLEECNSCGATLQDEHIKDTGRDPLVESVLGAATGGFIELHRSFHVLVLQHKFPAGQHHLVAVPKATCYDLRKLRRRQVLMVKKLRESGMSCLRTRMRLAPAAPDPMVMCGFSYPADYNQLHLHLVTPPFKNMNLFSSHVFYPCEEVEAQLGSKYGQVKPHVALDPGSEDRVLMQAAELDRRARMKQL